MPSGYIPIFIFLAIAICFPVVLILAAKLIRPSAMEFEPESFQQMAGLVCYYSGVKFQIGRAHV